MATTAELKQAGFNDTEIADYTAKQSASLSQAGFSPEEISVHQGPNFGLRPNGTPKGTGFLGVLELPGGGSATEFSIGVQLESKGGKETDIPSLVPTLTQQEIDLMVSDIIPNRKEIPSGILQKAVDHANKRVREGKSVFAEATKAGPISPDEPVTDPEQLFTGIPEIPLSLPTAGADPKSIASQSIQKALDLTLLPPGPPSIGQASARNIRELKKRPPLPPNATGEERLDRVLHIISDPIIRTTYKIMKGVMLGAPDIAWSALKKILPPEMQEEMRGQTLDQAIDEALGYDPGAFVEFIGEAAEFVGGLKTAGKLLGPLGTPRGAAQKAVAESLRFGGARAAREISKATAEAIDIDTQYGYQGATGVATDMALGAGFSYLRSAASPVIRKVADSAFGREVEKATHRVAVELTKKFPLVMDSIRKNPETHFTKQVLKVVKEKTGLSSKDMTLVQKAAIKHIAREGSRAFKLARNNYLKNVPPDIVRAVKRRGLQLPARVPPPAAPVAKVPVELAVTPPKPVKAIEAKPTLSRSSIRGDIIRLSFDALGKVPTAAELKKMLATEGIQLSINKFAVDIVSGTQGVVNFRIDVADEQGRSSAKLAKEVFDTKIGTENFFRAETTLEREIPLKERFGAVQKEAVRRLAGITRPPTEAKVVKPPTLVQKPTAKPAMATQAQKAKVHIIAKEKAFISKKGKLKPGYRRLAKAMTGQTSIAKMTKDQASDFINALTRLPEPRLVKGVLVPPSLPFTKVLARRGQFQQVFKEPTPLAIITDPSFYAVQLGVKSLVEPLEKAKQDFDFEYRKAAHALDKKGVVIDKVGKTTAKERVMAKIRNIPTRAREEMGRLLDKHEVAPADLDPEKTKIFNYFRGLSRTILKRQNEARTKLGWPTIPSRKAYQRRIATDIAREMLAGKYPFPEGIKFWSGINTGEKVFNPMEFRRKLEDDVYNLFTKDPVQASKAMMYTALKEIHLNQPLKFYKQQLNAIGKDMPEYKNLSAKERAELDKTMVIPASTRRWLTEYVNTSILGRQSWIDELVNNIVTKTGLKGVFDKILTPFGRTVGRKPITDFFRRVGRMQMAGVLGPRPRLILRNKFQLTQNLALYTNKANIRAFGPNNTELNALLDQSRFLRDYTGLEDLPVDIAGKIEKLWHSAFQWSAKSNARQAMEVSYWDIRELIDNPIYKKHGWKREHLLKEMEFGASATQFHYTALGMPQIFRHKTLLPMTRLTSWWMNYFSKFHREAIHRGFTGRPSWAGSDGPTLPWSRRLGWLRYVVFGGMILNTMGYTRSFLFGAAPTGWPPAMQFSWNAYLYTVSQNEQQKATAKKRMAQAAKTFIPGYIAFKDFEAVWTGRKDLSSLLFYKKVKK